ncbi:unnamed protein product [Linum tenue]|uniref:Uncharacterized protein n=1 Tax=Linum tenue TaxID=586396 RepID=A0AAV0IVK7_9ROSI|nr:unnamed protein product [Linum tenue]
MNNILLAKWMWKYAIDGSSWSWNLIDIKFPNPSFSESWLWRLDFCRTLQTHFAVNAKYNCPISTKFAGDVELPHKDEYTEARKWWKYRNSSDVHSTLAFNDANDVKSSCVTKKRGISTAPSAASNACTD